MEANILMGYQFILSVGVILTIQIIAVLLLRKPTGALYGGVSRYRLWLLPVAWSCVVFIGNSIDLGLAAKFSPLSNSMNPALNQIGESLSINGFVVETVSKIPIVNTIWDNPYVLPISLVWLLGMILHIGLFFSQFVGFGKLLRSKGRLLESREKQTFLQVMGLHASVKVWRCSNIQSPAVYGIVNRSIMIPIDFESQFTDSQQRASLSHEAVHYRRLDNLTNLLAYLIRVVFWFNPIMYLAYRCFRLDQEISCDCIVLNQASDFERRDYAMALISHTRPVGILAGIVSVSSWNDFNNLKERSKMIYTIDNTRNSNSLKYLMLAGLLIGGGVGTAAADFKSQTLAEVSSSLNATSSNNRSLRAAKDIIGIEVQILELNLSDSSRSTVNATLFEQHGPINVNNEGAYINTSFTDLDSVQKLLSLNGTIEVLNTFSIQVASNQKALIQDADQEYFITSFEKASVDGVVSGNDGKEEFLSGLSLGITPHINNANEILLRVNPRVSKVSSAIRVVDGIEMDLVKSIIKESDSVIKVENEMITVLGGLVFEGTSEEVVILLKPIL